MFMGFVIFVFNLVKAFFLILIVALGVGFLTLMERKVLAYIQIRKGPNKVGIVGLPQPLADAIKLLIKESIFVTLSNKPIFIGAPIAAIIIIIAL